MKKHILFIVENNPYPHDIRVRNEAEAAKEFGYDVSVISPKGSNSPDAFETVNGIDVYRHFLPAEGGGKFGFLLEYATALFWELFLAAKIYLKQPFHYIHSANPPDHVFLIAIIFKLMGVKYIFDHHDISPENYVAKFGRKDIFFKALLWMEKLTFKCADISISTNESYKKVAVSRGGMKPESVFVVRNGPNMKRVQFMRPNPELKNGFDYLVSYVGVIGNQEGLDNLLYSIEYLVYEKNLENIKFIVIGKGAELENLRALSRKLKIEKYITFTGFIPYRDLYEILASSDLCVNPEHRNEFTDRSTMLKIMDYMVFGKPIVQFETTEGRFTASKAAAYVMQNDNAKFAETIVTLLNDPGRRKQMGEFGKNRIETELKWDYQKINLKRAYEYLDLIC